MTERLSFSLAPPAVVQWVIVWAPWSALTGSNLSPASTGTCVVDGSSLEQTQ